MKKLFFFILVLIFIFNTQIFNQTKGKLVIIGGVQTHDIEKEFVELAGGSNARIILIPNAGSEPKLNSEIDQKKFQELGAAADYILFTRQTADDEANIKKMEWANAVFFLGGDQSDLTRDMLGTKLLQKAFEIYNSGGVVGGSSAGAAVMSKIMLTGNELINQDSTRAYITIQEGNIETKEGFGFIKSAIIDQHFLKRKRLNRLISVVLEHPENLGIGIDESTAIVVNPDNTFQVIGKSLVLVFNATRASDISTNKDGLLSASGIQLDILKSGDIYNMDKKVVIK